MPMVTMTPLAALLATLLQAQQPAAPAEARPALAALAKPPATNAFAVEVNPVAVPVPGHPGQAAMFIRLGGGALESNGNPKTGMFSAGAVIALRVLDATGRPVYERTEVRPIHGLMSDAKETLAKPLESRQFLELAPGTYRVQVAAYDQVAKQSSVVTVTYEAPAQTPPIVDSLMIVDHAERLPADRPDDSADPFVVSGVLLHPAYDAGVNRMVQPALNFILPLVLAPGAKAPDATLSLLEKGSTIASVPLALGTADETGKFIAVGRVPLDKVPAGTYQLQITVGSGAGAPSRAAPLTVVQ